MSLSFKAVLFSVLSPTVYVFSPPTPVSIPHCRVFYFLVALILLTILSLSICVVSWSFSPLKWNGKAKTEWIWGDSFFLTCIKVQNSALVKSFLQSMSRFWEAPESVSQCSFCQRHINIFLSPSPWEPGRINTEKAHESVEGSHYNWAPKGGREGSLSC